MYVKTHDYPNTVRYTEYYNPETRSKPKPANALIQKRTSTLRKIPKSRVLRKFKKGLYVYKLQSIRQDKRTLRIQYNRFLNKTNKIESGYKIGKTRYYFEKRQNTSLLPVTLHTEGPGRRLCKYDQKPLLTPHPNQTFQAETEERGQWVFSIAHTNEETNLQDQTPENIPAL